jgi:hypothetical protein
MMNDLELGAILSDVRSGDEVAVRVLADHYEGRGEEVLAASLRALTGMVSRLYEARQDLLEAGPEDDEKRNTLTLDLDCGGRFEWFRTTNRGVTRERQGREGHHAALSVLFAEYEEARPAFEFLLRRLQQGAQPIRFALALNPRKWGHKAFSHIVGDEDYLALDEEDHLPRLRDAIRHRLARYAIEWQGEEEEAQDRARLWAELAEEARRAGRRFRKRPVRRRERLELTDDPSLYQVRALTADFGPFEPVATTAEKGGVA